MKTYLENHETWWLYHYKPLNHLLFGVSFEYNKENIEKYVILHVDKLSLANIFGGRSLSPIMRKNMSVLCEEFMSNAIRIFNIEIPQETRSYLESIEGDDYHDFYQNVPYYVYDIFKLIYDKIGDKEKTWIPRSDELARGFTNWLVFRCLNYTNPYGGN
jgi:hypothetical protein